MKTANRLPHRQHGVVLILAMFIVVLVTSIAVATTWRFELGQMRNESRWHGAMIRSYGYSAENFAMKLLEDDDDAIDCLTPDLEKRQDLWAADLPTMETDEGAIDLKIEDLNRRFNINMLADPFVPLPNATYSTPASLFTEAQRMFIRLLQIVEIEGRHMDIAQAIEITDAVIDWVDQDNNPHGNGGAEQSYYQGLQEPYTIGNQPMISVSEFALVKGVTPELYAKLAPYLTALNSDQRLNINTMAPEMERIFNYNESLEPFDERRLAMLRENPSARKKKPATQPVQTGPNLLKAPPGCATQQNEAIENSLVLSELRNTGPNSGMTWNTSFFDRYVGRASSYFAVSSEVRVGELVRTNKSLVRRKARGKEGIQVVRRSDGNF